jgi:NAD(P)-dependent dehydrogenase (short-subunit alcohol dehydrogenase family)
MTNDMFNLDGRVAIVTGASGLLGRQHSRALAQYGARLILADIAPDGCQALAAELGARVAHCDVTDKQSWASLIGLAIREYGRVDILVNNAAFTNQSRSPSFGAPFLEVPLEDWRRILDVNLTGVFLGCQAAGARMLQQGSGSIINMASLYGVVSPNHRMYPGTGIVQPPAYSISKAGVIALTRYLATLWAASNVRVNCITPGGIFNDHNDLFRERYGTLCPVGRMADETEMRGALIYLASGASSYCTGHNLVVDGGWTAW